MTPGTLDLTELEIATAATLGQDPFAPPLPDIDREQQPRSALESAIRPALERPPCLVSFSGGRDSSAVLAVATDVARREGHELPIPTTLQFVEHPKADESRWQELVIRHLALPNWQRHVIRSELDWIGPVAQKVLRRHGVLFPPNAFMFMPMLEDSRGGSLLTGIDGDSLLDTGPSGRVMAVISGRARPEPRDLLRLAFALTPMRLRVSIQARRRPLQLVWLQPDARKTYELALVAEGLSQPMRWDKAVQWLASRRGLSLMRKSFEVLAHATECEIHHPLSELTFLSAAARWGGRTGFLDRTAATRALFGDLLPERLIARPNKAHLGDVFWKTWSHDFATSSDLKLPENPVVDQRALRRVWACPLPDPHTSMLLQSAWLMTVG